ncbi:MAG: MBL fold metallo-hydrolase [Actinomycetota bacterium]|nr:MAG: MBL fold metallo-hydrolase [Actinomycetota bacterium]
MTYHGAVHVGGPAQVRELTALTVSKLAVGPYDNNVYLLRCRDSGDQLLIDAAAEPGRVLDLIGAGGLATVVTTHRHPDHWQALAPVVAATGARTVAHPVDAPEIPVATRTEVRDGDEIAVGAVTLRVIHLTGHTPGSIALVYDDPTGHPHVFTGDCLFPGGVGRTTNPAEFASLYDGVVARLFDALPDETWVYPGHGNDTTLGAERPHLAQWRERGW